MIRVHQVKCRTPEEIEVKLLKKLKMKKGDLLSWKIRRQSVDARGHKVLFSYVIDAEVRNEQKYLKLQDVTPTPDETFRFTPTGTEPLENRPVVVGFGPAGMFAALLLAQYGYRPLIVERGSEIHKRAEKVNTFWNGGELDPECNVQYGMGGAGAFSDGKLTTRSKDKRSVKVYDELVRLGADEKIRIEQHPHIGTDGFRIILDNLRKDIESLGGEFLFDTRLDDLVVEDGRLKAIALSDGRTIGCEALIFAAGHSASDTLKMVMKRGVKARSKPYAIGVRIEHLQDFINRAMLGDSADNPLLLPARYQLTYTASTGRGVYSFCMCPGGYVIAASSAPQSLVVNGMSYSKREGTNANSALLVQTNPGKDLPEEEAIAAGLALQEDIERKAWEVTKSYKAPVQLAKDFIEGKVSDHFEQVKPTYPEAIGTVFADLNTILPKEVCLSLKEGLLNFEKKVPGFLDGALLTGVETRSSSALRLDRDSDSLQSAIAGFYPCGEGSGYAGGIMTSAIDGLRCAMALMSTFDRPARGNVK